MDDFIRSAARPRARTGFGIQLRQYPRGQSSGKWSDDVTSQFFRQLGANSAGATAGTPALATPTPGRNVGGTLVRLAPVAGMAISLLVCPYHLPPPQTDAGQHYSFAEHTPATKVVAGAMSQF